MAEKILRTRKQVSVTLENEIKDRLMEISKETDIPMSRLMDRAMKMYIDDYDKNKGNI